MRTNLRLEAVKIHFRCHLTSVPTKSPLSHPNSAHECGNNMYDLACCKRRCLIALSCFLMSFLMTATFLGCAREQKLKSKLDVKC